ncbi:response regulator transcription factor [Paenibacillus oceani]|uniref:Response regulator transcription factor n=1 Tax=Paenibacillus oceani TaxID=2772510 RepID=A0A927C8W5_9BACL|nr:response regulator transcription factor [Paenibacillus oceani]MBD2863019.1 response regulator transcription factor [Paenibacillus oceani]
MTRILIVEDDKLLNEGLTFALGKQHYDVIGAFSYDEGLSAFRKFSPDLLILDINLPDRKGTELCLAIRQTSQVPIVFLTANDSERDIVEGFELGADDYVSKPFSMAVLCQHVKAILRRSGKDGADDTFTDRDIAVHYARMKVYKRGREVKLTANEFKLLAILTRHNGQVLTRQIILEKLWDLDGNFVDENTLSVNIKRLRDKLEDDVKNPDYIKTVFGIGYTWGE